MTDELKKQMQALAADSSNPSLAAVAKEWLVEAGEVESLTAHLDAKAEDA